MKNRIESECADIRNDEKWGDKEFICMKKISFTENIQPKEFGIMLRDNRNAIYGIPTEELEKLREFYDSH